MSCISHLNLCPASGDTENVLLQKILQSVNAGGGVAGVSSISLNGGPPQTGAVAISTGGTVTSVNGDPGPAVSLNSGEIPEGANLYFTNARAIASTLTGFVAGAGTVTAADSILTALQKSSFVTNDLLNFRDTNAHADASIYINSGATEIVKVIGASAFISLASERLQRNIDSGKLALLGGISKSTGAYVEAHGDTSATVGHILLTTKGRASGSEGNLQIFNAAVASGAADIRAAMSWEGNWAFTPTWNNGATTFTGLKSNVTNTASAATSLLMDLQVGGTSRFAVKANGNVGIGTASPTNLLSVDIGTDINLHIRSLTVGGVEGSSIVSLNDAVSAFKPLYLDASVIALNSSVVGNVGIGTVIPQGPLSIVRAGGASAGIYEVLTDAFNYSRLFLSTPAGNHLIRTEAAGGGTLRILQVGTGPSVGTNIAGINSIYHAGQSTGTGLSGSILLQTSPAGSTGAAVNALVTRVTISSTDITHAVAVRLAITSGTNQRAGNTTLVGGTVTVANTTVTANTIVMLTRKTSGGTIGTAITYTVSAATSFTINSDNILDTSVFSYFLIEVP